MHLGGRYGQDLDCALRVGIVVALAFVPVEDVVDAFDAVVKDKFFKKNADISTIIDYFEVAWIGKVGRNGKRKSPLFPIDMLLLCSCYETVIEKLPRTNNNVEAWHRRFSSLVRKKLPRFWWSSMMLVVRLHLENASVTLRMMNV